MIFNHFVNLFEAFIDTFFLYSLCTSHKKNSLFYSAILSILHFSFIETVNYFSPTELFLFSVYIAAYYFYLSVTTDMDIGEKLFYASIPSAIYSVTCLTMLFSASMLLYGKIGYEPLMTEHRILIIVTVHIIQAALFWFFAKLIRKEKPMLTGKEGLMAAAALILLTNLQTCFEGVVFDSEHLSHFMLGGIYITLVFVLLLVAVFGMIYRQSKKEAKMEFDLRLLKAQQISNEKVMKAQQEVRQMRHDMKHFIDVLCLESDGSEKMQNIIDEYRKKAGTAIVPLQTRNSAVNYVLNIKRDQAASKGIEFVCSLNITHEIIMEDSDLYLLLSNLLDNAIEHIGMKKKIMVNMYDVRNMFMIRVSNSIDALVFNAKGELSANGDSEHGFGIDTIRGIAEKYNGTFEMIEQDHEFIAGVMIPNR